MRGDDATAITTTGRADAGPRARIAAAASAALESGRSVLIGGGPGSGKSRLARRLLEGLDAATPVLVVRATAEQREREFSALTSAWQLAGGRVTTGRGLVESLVRHWSATSPLQPVVLVEDAQLLDAQSAQALLTAAASGALRLVLTVVDDGEPPQGATAAVERAWVEGWLDRWDLAPLELREVREALGRDGAIATLAQAATALDATGGVPLLLRELRAQPDAGDGHPGPRMRAALHRVIATLRAGERGLIRSLDRHSAVPEREAVARIGAHRVDLLVEHGLLLRLDDGKLRAASSLVTQRLRVLAHAAGEIEQPITIAAAGADARLAVVLRRAVEGRAAEALALLPGHGVEAHDPAVVTATLLVRALVGERTERLPEHLESALSDTLRSGDAERSRLLAVVAGAVLLDRDETARAAESLAAAGELPGPSTGRLAAARHALLARCAVARGDLAAAHRCLDAARRADSNDVLSGEQVRLAAIEVQLAEGQAEEARAAALEGMRERARLAQPRSELAVLAWAGGADPVTLLGDADGLADSPRVRLIDRSLRAAAENSPIGALRGEAEASSMPRITRLLRAVAAERRGEPVDRAAALFGTRVGAAPLTDRERQVAVLAGEGLSSRQIAAELFVSVRTVESHVLRARRKLGAEGKRTLGRRLRELGLA